MIKLEHGENKNGEIIHIDKAERGLACGLLCPCCESPLVAAKGEKMAHHFKHQSKGDCKGAGETALHLIAKDVIKELGYISVRLKGDRERSRLILNDVKLEKGEKGYVPDITAMLDCGEKIYIEVMVTHAVDSLKLEKIKRDGVLAIELNFRLKNREKLSNANIRKFILDSVSGERLLISFWLNLPEDSYYQRRYEKICNEKRGSMSGSDDSLVYSKSKLLDRNYMKTIGRKTKKKPTKKQTESAKKIRQRYISKSKHHVRSMIKSYIDKRHQSHLIKKNYTAIEKKFPKYQDIVSPERYVVICRGVFEKIERAVNAKWAIEKNKKYRELN